MADAVVEIADSAVPVLVAPEPALLEQVMQTQAAMVREQLAFPESVLVEPLERL